MFTQRFISGMFTRISLRNIEDDTVIVYYTNHSSSWINDLSAAEKWLSEQETPGL